jgi:hypothetical protein
MDVPGTLPIIIPRPRAKPDGQRKDNAREIKNTEDRLVVTCQPLRQENVEICPTVLGVTTGNICQGAPKSVEEKHENLDEDDANQDCCNLESMHRRENGDRKNAASEDPPH